MRTGLPVIESPRAMILTVDWRSANPAGVPATAAVNDSAAMAEVILKRIVFELVRRQERIDHPECWTMMSNMSKLSFL